MRGGDLEGQEAPHGLAGEASRRIVVSTENATFNVR